MANNSQYKISKTQRKIYISKYLKYKKFEKELI